MQKFGYAIAIFIVVMNIIGFVIMASDKRKAKKGLWRIPEKNFFIVSALGGAVGTYIGMYYFRHKTKHWYFVVGIPAILIAEVAAVIFITKMLH